MSEVDRERRGTIGSTSEQAILESFLRQIKVLYFPPICESFFHKSFPVYGTLHTARTQQG